LQQYKYAFSNGRNQLKSISTWNESIFEEDLQLEFPGLYNYILNLSKENLANG